MREHFYCFQLVGNESSIKRMVASVYLVDSKKQEQTLRVCICDDLPHIVLACDEEQKSDPNSELLQDHLAVSVGYDRALTVIASETTTGLESMCAILPDHEIAIPPETIWTAGATIVLDFKIEMLKANENASVQISIMSQDDGGNEIPLSVPPRAHLIWQQKNVASVTKLREAWESSSDGSLSPQRRSWATRQSAQPYLSSYMNSGHKSVSMPRHVQPSYAKVESVMQRKMTKMQEIEAQLKHEEQQTKWAQERKRIMEERKPPVYSTTTPQTGDKKWSGSSVSSYKDWNIIQDKSAHSATSSQLSDKKWSSSSTSSYRESDWNVVRDPRATLPTVNSSYDDDGEPLPAWAKGFGEDFNYDDVVVV